MAAQAKKVLKKEREKLEKLNAKNANSKAKLLSKVTKLDADTVLNNIDIADIQAVEDSL